MLLDSVGMGRRQIFQSAAAPDGVEHTLQFVKRASLSTLQPQWTLVTAQQARQFTGPDHHLACCVAHQHLATGDVNVAALRVVHQLEVGATNTQCRGTGGDQYRARLRFAQPPRDQTQRPTQQGQRGTIIRLGLSPVLQHRHSAVGAHHQQAPIRQHHVRGGAHLGLDPFTNTNRRTRHCRALHASCIEHRHRAIDALKPPCHHRLRRRAGQPKARQQAEYG